MSSRPPCHYCEGTGWNDEAIRVDVDDYLGAECGLCEGTGEAMHSANRRTYWRGPVYFVGGWSHAGDILEFLALARRTLIRERGSWRSPHANNQYGYIRQMAVSPEMLPRDIEPPDAPVPADTERNREATPLPVWPRPKTTHGEL